MEIDELFKEILEYTIKIIQKKYSVTESEAQRLLVIALDENEFEVFRSIETALRNKKWLATAPERVLANKRLEAEEIQVGDMVAWEHDESVHGEVIELLSNEYVDMVRFRTRDGEIKEMLLDECVTA